MRVLALDCALGGCAAGVFCGETSLAEAHEPGPSGQSARLANLVAGVLRQAGDRIGLVAVTVGPGSFTGLRASIALAQGLANGMECPIAAVGVAEALRRDVAAPRVSAELWVVLQSRPDRIFLVLEEAPARSCALDALPAVTGPTLLAGNAAAIVAARLADARVVSHPIGTPTLASVAAIGLQRHRGALPPLSAMPQYVDAPETTRPA